MKNRKLWISLVAGILVAALLLSLILAALPVRAEQSSSEIRDQINQMQADNAALEAEINKLKEQQKDNATDIQDLVVQKSVIEQQVGLLHAQIKNLNEQIAAFSVLIADKQEDLEEAERKLETLNEKHKDRIQAMEEDGQLSYWSVLFQANSFSDLLDRLNMIEEIAASDRRRLDEMREAAREVAAAKEELVKERQELQQTKQTMTQLQEEQAAKAQQAQAVLQQLLDKGEEFEKLMEKAEEELTELEKDIAQKESDYEEAVDREYWATYTTPPPPPPPTTLPPVQVGGGTGGDVNVDESGISWLVPCSYIRVSSPFLPSGRLHPTQGVIKPHLGVDLAAPCPTPIVASRSGIVEVSQYSSSAGYYVTIDHLDGYKSVYMHMCHVPNVKVGQTVAQGQVIGCVGSTGWSTGNHLHFGIYKNGAAVDPMDYIG